MRIVNLTIFLLTSAVYSFGQIGSIEGLVFDRWRGKGLAGANISLLGTTKNYASDSVGNFKLDSIFFGLYRIKVSMVAYGDTTVTVNVDGHVRTNVILPPPCEYEKRTNDRRCPKCHKVDKSIPIFYGLIVVAKGQRLKEHYDGGCEISYCMPNWYCKRDKLKF